MSETSAGDDIAQIARGGRTNFLGFFLRLAARIPFLFIAGRAAAYGPEALGRFASALVVIELSAMLCTLGEKRGLAQRLAEFGRASGQCRRRWHAGCLFDLERAGAGVLAGARAAVSQRQVTARSTG